MPPIIQLTDDDARELRRLRRKVDGLRVAGMPYTNTADAISIGPPPVAPAAPAAQATRSDFFRVKVTKDGGVAGSMATGTTCSFTYSLKDPSGNAVKNTDGSGATGLTPDVPRFAACAYDQPADDSPGVAYRDSSGVVHLLWAVKEKPTGATISVVTDEALDGSSNLTMTKTSILVLDKATAGSPSIVVPHC